MDVCVYGQVMLTRPNQPTNQPNQPIPPPTTHSYLGQHANIITLKDLFVRDNAHAGGGNGAGPPAPGAHGDAPPADELYIVMEVRGRCWLRVCVFWAAGWMVYELAGWPATWTID
jgi:hypothetical protein